MASIDLPGRQLRKSTLLSRSQEPRPPSAPLTKEKPPRHERSRRSFFKRRPQRAPLQPSTNYTTPAVLHRDQLYCIGDVVAVEGKEGDLFYAQITGLLTDRYGEKSASLAWLVPTTHSSRQFDPVTYTYGESDNLPRKLDCLHLVNNSLTIDHFKSGLSLV